MSYLATNFLSHGLRICRGPHMVQSSSDATLDVDGYPVGTLASIQSYRIQTSEAAGCRDKCLPRMRSAH